MGKGALKFGGKSGILPVPRQIFKKPYKHQVYQKEQDTGYAEGILHPKGITRDFVPPKVFTPESRLLKSAAQPKKQFSPEEFSKLPTAQQYRIKNAELRRAYLKESYDAEVKRLERVEYAKQKSEEEKAQMKLEADNHDKSKAELYTIPTIESYLSGPLIKPRTPEQKEALQLKKEANRLQQELDVKTNKAIKLLELYNASAAFAITESKLELMVDAAFSESKLIDANNITNSSVEKLHRLPSTSEFDSALKDAIVGNVNKGPGFDVVNDTLNGYNGELHSLAEQLKIEKREKAKLETSLKEANMRKLHEEMMNERKAASVQDN
ncbi:hypothetical protein CANARDRAFT_28247 [[Candida] arabinofermentans NRRL YB-2248]|uniref:Uncharacterized protein n=1 Tax=[Candida] arabinofermentans NRRL YB-2248 TaxID=983967 RepID=A0A1E4T146_9ASCO|nr:hypothetical protein CANARDRAFT_28247 [[Candida] arabinofermentans NRRL YB-2248]